MLQKVNSSFIIKYFKDIFKLYANKKSYNIFAMLK